MVLPPLRRLLGPCRRYIAPVAAGWGLLMMATIFAIAAVASPDCRCNWLEDWHTFPLLSEAAMYPPQRLWFMAMVPPTAVLIYITGALFVDAVRRQMPDERIVIRLLHWTLGIACFHLFWLGVLDMKRFFMPHVVVAYTYFLVAEGHFILQTYALVRLFARADPALVTPRHWYPVYMNFCGFFCGGLFWYFYSIEIPERAQVETLTIAFQMLSVGFLGPIINQDLVPRKKEA